MDWGVCTRLLSGVVSGFPHSLSRPLESLIPSGETVLWQRSPCVQKHSPIRLAWTTCYKVD